MNPMFWVVDGFRWAHLGNGVGAQSTMRGPAPLSLALPVSGAFVFRRSERNIVDLL